MARLSHLRPVADVAIESDFPFSALQNNPAPLVFGRMTARREVTRFGVGEGPDDEPSCASKVISG